ncbi:DUF2239 family protein [Dyella sp. 2RAB6]|uniref:DUF2239 family protein n=1 Tax=Dyella sp. 2RAB6 TaxID=3232992 RepID=UPI003F90A9F0
MSPPNNPLHPARHIRLFDRHWAWLEAQPIGAGATLRRLVERACRDIDGHYRKAAAKEACYFHMRDAAGDRPQFEEAARALFADDRSRLRQCIAAWPEEVRTRIEAMLGGA